MADIFSWEKRSAIMRSIKPWGNKSTELRLVLLLRQSRIKGWRRHFKMLGRPDFVFRKERVAVFVDGDFWHGNPRKFKLPLTNPDFWQKKIQYNRTKDRRVTKRIRESGWTVIRIWESTLRRSPAKCLKRVQKALRKI